MNSMKRSFIAATWLLVAPISIALSGCAVDSSESDSLAAPRAGEVTEASTDEAQSAVTGCSATGCANCVLHARCLKPSLPYGLFDCSDKTGIINSWTPAVGSVAVMDVGPYCHVGYVYQVDGSGEDAIIWLDEGNLPSGTCHKGRHGTASQLRILGYFA